MTFASVTSALCQFSSANMISIGTKQGIEIALKLILCICNRDIRGDIQLCGFCACGMCAYGRCGWGIGVCEFITS